MMNPLQFVQAMRNPQEFMRKMMENSQVMQNPMAKNAMEMAQNGNMQGIEQMARNLCKEKGLNADDVFNQIKSGLGN